MRSHCSGPARAHELHCACPAEAVRLGRVIRLASGSSPPTSYTYDGDGNRLSRVDNTGTTTYAYDALNRLTTLAPPGAPARAYTHDGVGNLTSAGDSGGPGGTVSYGYDAANELTSLTQPGGATVTYGYTKTLRTSISDPNGVATTLSYDTAGRQVAIKATGPGGTLENLTQTYATATGTDTGLVQSQTDSLGAKTTTYGYDGLNRLSGATTSGSPATSYAYAYDPNSNLVQATHNGTPGPLYGFNSADELTTAGGNPYGTYDGAGNLTADTPPASPGLSLAYNDKNQTSSITPTGGAAIALTYAGVGQTQRTQAGTTSFVNGAFGVDSQSDSSGQSFFTRDNQGNLVSERTPTGTYYYLFDLHGSVIGLTDSTGAIADTYAYDPYGNQVSSTGTVANPWRYSAGYYDAATGLTKFGTRYYDPTTGRFTQQDPVVGSLVDPITLAPYAYAGDNPVNFVDPSGLSCAGSVFSFLGSALGGLGATLVAPETGGGSLIAYGATLANIGTLSGVVSSC